MSHFAVLVVTKDASIAALKAALQPFHEFECTGIDDVYVADIDKTEEERTSYQSQKERRFKDAAGALYVPHDDRFYRDWTAEDEAKYGRAPGGSGSGDGISWHSKDWNDGRGYRSKIHHCPEGFEEVEVPASELMSFREFLIRYDDDDHRLVPFGTSPKLYDVHKYGYVTLDEAGEVLTVIDRTNPNKQWDWWRVGGRYAGRLRVVGGSAPTDAARVGDLDLNSMKAMRQAERQAHIFELMQDAGATRQEVETAILAAPIIHGLWMQLQEPKPRGPDFYAWAEANCAEGTTFAKVARKAWELPKFGTAKTIDEWIDAAPYLTSWAVLKDGEWTEKGSMGWFGMASDEKDEAEWEAAVSAMLASLPDDAWITVVDCHI